MCVFQCIRNRKSAYSGMHGAFHFIFDFHKRIMYESWKTYVKMFYANVTTAYRYTKGITQKKKHSLIKSYQNYFIRRRRKQNVYFFSTQILQKRWSLFQASGAVSQLGAEMKTSGPVHTGSDTRQYTFMFSIKLAIASFIKNKLVYCRVSLPLWTSPIANI